jgi:serine protease
VDEATMHRLGEDPRVEVAEPNYVYGIEPWEESAAPVEPADGKPGAFPNDPLFKSQWHLTMIDMPAAWRRGQGKGAVVAIIDTGVSSGEGKLPRVPDLEGTNFVPGYNFVTDNDRPDDDHGHGTHVAGTVAQRTHNDFGVAGVAPQASIMPLKVLTKQGWGTAGDIAEAIRWAADHGAHVINMSLGGGGYSAVMAKAVKYAHEKGLVVVCAAGNTGRARVEYPAAYPGALAVSAVGPDGDRAWYSSYGKELFIAAPGGDTRVDLNGDGIADGVLQDTIALGDPTRHGFFPFQGTSMATPHVAGAAALLVGRGVTDPNAVTRLLGDNAAKKQDRTQYGHGLLDAGATLKAAGRQDPVRMGMTLSLVGVMVWLARRRMGSQRVKLGWTGLLASLVAGAGLFPFKQWVGFSVMAELFVTPLPAWERVLLGPSWGPSALGCSALVPVVASLLLLGVQKLRGALVGITLGFAAFLLAEAGAGYVDVHYIPGHGLLDAAWLATHGLVCTGLGWLLMRR